MHCGLSVTKELLSAKIVKSPKDWFKTTSTVLGRVRKKQDAKRFLDVGKVREVEKKKLHTSIKLEEKFKDTDTSAQIASSTHQLKLNGWCTCCEG